MTQPTTAWTFADYYNAIGERVFNTSAPTGTQLTTCKRFVNEGYQIFLQSHNWTFLYPTYTLSIASGDVDTDLPEDFGAISGLVERSAGSQYTGLQEVSPDEINRRRAVNDVSGIPSMYAIQPKTFSASTGQMWEMLVYPKPDSAISLVFQYRKLAGKLSSASDYPYGGALHSMTILQAAYMVWEQEKDAEGGIQERKFDKYLANSIKIDNDLIPRIVNAGRKRPLYINLTSIEGVE